jgi:CRISPR-associated protein Csb2
MSRAIVISVHLHEGRYHGLPEWPPSPARLFQAFVSAAADGSLSDGDRAALMWLEALSPPVIGSPRARLGQGFTTYVPNNDLDAVGRDPRRTSEIRAGKWIKPRLIDAEPVFLYAWNFRGSDEQYARTVCAIADRLYQFGRGIDMAWAWGEMLAAEDVEARLSKYAGVVYRPALRSGRTLACPEPGSLASLERRYVASAQRFKSDGLGNTARQLFSQPPKPRFRQVAYDSLPSRRMYELREGSNEASFGVWPLVRASRLVECLRDGAVNKLRKSLPDRSLQIEQVLVGRKADGTDEASTVSRVRIVPLPSIGHQHVDRGIRRVLVEVPGSCPLRADDVHWAFSGLDITDPKTGEVLDLILTPSGDEHMLAHYGVTNQIRSRVWRTVTPAALPESARRRRIDPARVAAEAKDGLERAGEQGRAAAAVAQALRHIEVRDQVEAVRVQREPFEAKGDRVEAFARGTRFAKERLWHLEITFNAPIAGPLAIGDGRFLGLGVMAPLERTQGIQTFVVEHGLAATADPIEVARALRRAVMARVQNVLGARAVMPRFFTGHDSDGSPARTNHSHLTFLFDPSTTRLLVVAPHEIDRRNPTPEEVGNLESLDEALTHFRELRAGSSGCLTLRASPIEPRADPLFAPSRVWESLTPYHVTRHAKRLGAAEALSADLLAECRRHRLPEPRIAPRELRGVPGVGLVGSARLTFEVAVEGPIVLGRSRHLGGGLFAGTASAATSENSSGALGR